MGLAEIKMYGVGFFVVAMLFGLWVVWNLGRHESGIAHIKKEIERLSK